MLRLPDGARRWIARHLPWYDDDAATARVSRTRDVVAESVDAESSLRRILTERRADDRVRDNFRLSDERLRERP